MPLRKQDPANIPNSAATPLASRTPPFWASTNHCTLPTIGAPREPHFQLRARMDHALGLEPLPRAPTRLRSVWWKESPCSLASSCNLPLHLDYVDCRSSHDS